VAETVTDLVLERVTVGDQDLGYVVGLGLNVLDKDPVSDVDRVRVRVPVGVTVGVGTRLIEIVLGPL